MKLNFVRGATLIACLGLFCLSSADAQRQREYSTFDRGYQSISDAAEQAGESLASYNDVELSSYDGESCTYDSCGCCPDRNCCRTGNSGGFGCGYWLQRPGQFYVAAEYLQVRATFSEATAFVTQTQNAVAAPPTITNIFTPIEYSYDPSFRVFGGYRLCDCCADIQFGYTRLNSGGTAAAIADAGQVIVAVPEEVISNGTGTGIFVDSNVTAQAYDLAFSRTIPLGGCCNTCDCGDSCTDDCCSVGGCGDACLPACCPAWDITWSAGVRYAEVDWDKTSAQISTAVGAPPGSFATTTLDFEGAGPRWGMEGRRYFGTKYRFSLFLKGDISLLLGNIGITNTRTQVVGATPALVNTTQFNTTQIVPVLDIVAGGTANITDRLSVSGGYLFSAWHDLGQRDTFDILNDPGFANPTDLTFDDANILGFDGYFVRAEFAF